MSRGSRPARATPDPRGQGRRDVADLSALGHELLGQHLNEATHVLGGPGPLLGGLGLGEELFDLATLGP